MSKETLDKLTAPHDHFMVDLRNSWHWLYRFAPPDTVQIGVDIARQGSDRSCAVVSHRPSTECDVIGLHLATSCSLATVQRLEAKLGEEETKKISEVKTDC